MAAFGVNNSTRLSSSISHLPTPLFSLLLILTLFPCIDTPWLASMSPASTYTSDDGPPAPSYNPNPTTTAAFSPQNLSGASVTSKQRSTIIVHKKSPLLVATPPHVTRALAYSHPFILPLNKLVGLLSWSTDDPWESYLLVAGFWALTLYGRELLLWAGPILVVIGLMLGMYSRRYSPLSSTSRTGEKHGREKESSDVVTKHHKSLDEIVDTLRVFTTRCNLLLGPFLSLTDFLSTQRTATSATTRPALTTLLIRILLVTPFWVLLGLPPVHIITSRRAILTFGTLALTWHSRPARICRVILWRSVAIRRICSFLTGLHFSGNVRSSTASTSKAKPPPPELPPRPAGLSTKHRAASPGVKFTFILYENQRRWLGLGWTSAMLAYERASWTDEHLNAAPSKDDFQLPQVETDTVRWRWVSGSQWKIEGATSPTLSPNQTPKGPKSSSALSKSDGGGWIYYDNKWNDGKRGVDSWGKYTRRRKWYRDAELVEITSSTEATPSATPNEAAALSEADEEAKATLSQKINTPAQKKSRPMSSASPKPGSDTGGGIDHNADPPSEPVGLNPDGDKNNNHANTTTPKRKSWFSGGGGGSSSSNNGKNRQTSKAESTSTTPSSSVRKKSLDGNPAVGNSRSHSHTNSISSSARARAIAAADPADDHVHGWKQREQHETARIFDGLGEDAVMGLS